MTHEISLHLHRHLLAVHPPLKAILRRLVGVEHILASDVTEGTHLVKSVRPLAAPTAFASPTNRITNSEAGSS